MNLIYAVIALQVLDLITTLIGLKRGLSEGNPLLAKLFGKISPSIALIAIKAAFVAVIWFGQDHFSRDVLIAVGAIYGLIVLNNLRLIVRVRG